MDIFYVSGHCLGHNPGECTHHASLRDTLTRVLCRGLLHLCHMYGFVTLCGNSSRFIILLDPIRRYTLKATP